jgi:hypothetical protein
MTDPAELQAGSTQRLGDTDNAQDRGAKSETSRCGKEALRQAQLQHVGRAHSGADASRPARRLLPERRPRLRQKVIDDDR